MPVAVDQDSGSLTILIIGYTAIAIGVIIAGIDVSKVFLAERALASAADAAAIDAAQGVDTGEVYDGPDLHCGAALPLDPQRASAMARESIEQRSPDLSHTFTQLEQPQTSVTGTTVTVAMRGEVEVPFGHLLSWLGIARNGGTVAVRDTAHASSPVTGSTAACEDHR